MAEESSESDRRDEHGRFTSGDDDDAPADDASTDENGGSTGGEGDTGEAFSGARREKAGVSAPSIGPDTIIEREPPEERLAKHEQSDTDALGKDKRRTVVGQTYGPTFARQASLYGGALLVVVVLAIGAKLLVDHADQPPEQNSVQAPWAQSDAPQRAPKPLQ